MFKYILLLFLSISAAFAGTQQPIVEQFDRSNTSITLTVIFYHNIYALNIAYIETMDRIGGVRPVIINVAGFAVWSVQNNTCTIHALKPEYVGDHKSDILGHELMHCLYGSYHTN